MPDNVICQKCGLHKDACNPHIKGFGSNNPKFVFILPYPEVEDDENELLQGKNGTVLLRYINGIDTKDIYITFLVKCPAYSNPITRNGFREHTSQEVSMCLKHLLREFKNIPESAKVMSFGSFCLTTLLDNKDLKITQLAGKNLELKFYGKTYSYTPNIDIGMTHRHPGYMKDLEVNINRFINGKCLNDTFMNDEKEKTKILNPAEAIVELDNVLNKYNDGEIDFWVCDLETSYGFNPWDGEIIMIAFSYTNAEYGFSIPLYINNNIDHKVDYEIPIINWDVNEIQRTKILSKFGQVIRTVPIVNHNLMFDLKWVVYKGIASIDNITIHGDTFNSAFQHQCSGPGISNSLDELCKRYLGLPDTWETKIKDYLSKYRLIKDRHYGNIPTGILSPYSGLDAYYTLRLKEYFDDNLDPCVLPALEIVNKSIKPLLESEIKGIKMDDSMISFLHIQYQEYIEQKYKYISSLSIPLKYINKAIYEAENINKNKKKPKPLDYEKIKRKAFNLGSTIMMQKLLFDKEYYSIPINKKLMTKSLKPSTDAESVEWYLNNVLDSERIEAYREQRPTIFKKLTEAKEFLESLGDFKRITKLDQDYITKYPLRIINGTYKIDVKINGTITGRLASSFHSTPNECDAKRVIISRWEDTGGLILSADESQLELRIMSALAEEHNMIQAFIDGYDFHTFTASQIYNVPIEDVTSEMRKHGKSTNFGISFGISEYTMSKTLGITVDRAKWIMDNYFMKNSNLRIWMDKCIEETRSTGYVVTQFGRKIPIQKAFSNSEFDIAQTARFAVNYRVQSSATDVVRHSVNGIWSEKSKLKMKSVYLGSIHDSILSDVYPGELFTILKLYYKHCIVNPPLQHKWLICPLKLDYTIGTSWGGALKCKIMDLTENSLCVIMSGLKKDFRKFLLQASRGYEVTVGEIKKKSIDPSTYPIDILYRDTELWEATVTLTSKLGV